MDLIYSIFWIVVLSMMAHKLIKILTYSDYHEYTPKGHTCTEVYDTFGFLVQRKNMVMCDKCMEKILSNYGDIEDFNEKHKHLRVEVINEEDRNIIP